METYVLTVFEKVWKVIDRPGIQWAPICCVRKRKLTQKIITINMPTTAIPDSTGSPMDVGTLITYVISNPVDATFNI
jgi:hypothetical protein